MTPSVIDASVVMCVLLGEPGTDAALHASEDAMISSVNFAEAVGKCAEKGLSDELALLFISANRISVVDFDSECAIIAGRLWAAAPKGKLSLGDRACIATAIKLRGTVVTADRIWTTFDLGCQVELIR